MKYDARHYDYLDGLRESGACNMFGASQYLVKEFRLDQKTAKAVVVDWMETFGERQEAKKNEEGL